MQLDSSCPICLEKEETREHLFMHCHLIQILWFTTHLGLHVPNQVSLNKWLMQWLNNPNPLAVQFFSITLWKIWKFRNQVVFKKVNFDPVVIAGSISEFVTQYNAVNKIVPKDVKRKEHVKQEGSIVGPLKLNVEVGYFGIGSTGWGMLVRNSMGQVRFVATKKEGIRVNPLTTEVLGLRWCLQWAQKENFDSLTIETNAKMVVKCLNGQSTISSIEKLFKIVGIPFHSCTTLLLLA